MTKLSLRQIASEIEISPAYLSYMVNGKRPWRKDLYQRYMGVVNTFVNSQIEPSAGPTSELDSPHVTWGGPHLHGVKGAARSTRAAPTGTLKSAEFGPEDHPTGWSFPLGHHQTWAIQPPA